MYVVCFYECMYMIYIYTHAAYVIIYHKDNNSCVFVVNGKENLSSD